jgi:hypothetical protein
MKLKRAFKICVGVMVTACCALAVTPGYDTGPETWLIRGFPVVPGSFRGVVSLDIAGDANPVCTATLVGQQVLLTAAHCAAGGDFVTFHIGTKTFRAKMTPSPLYDARGDSTAPPDPQSLDLALGLVESPVDSADPIPVGGTPVKGMDLILMGYGCTSPTGKTTNDGILREGSSELAQVQDVELVSYFPTGATLCYGDSGGPSFVRGQDGETDLLGIHSRGNMKDTNIDIRTDIAPAQAFFRQFAHDKGVSICGVTERCAVPADTQLDLLGLATAR